MTKDWHIKNDGRAILPDEMTTKELTDWLRGLLYWNDEEDNISYIDEDLINEVIRRLESGK